MVEVQHTFHEPPADRLLHRWRMQVSPRFEFTIKAWQVVTHDSGSPTYRRMKRGLPAEHHGQVGSFRLTSPVLAVWQRTLECARILRATGILLQCPRSFGPTDLLTELCRELDLVHVVDPMQTETVTPERTYHRLHGTSGSRHVHSVDERNGSRSGRRPAVAARAPRPPPGIVGNGWGGSFVSVSVRTATTGWLTRSVAGQDGSVAVGDLQRLAPPPYSGLVDAGLLGRAIELLTDGEHGEWALDVVHSSAAGGQATGDEALRIVRRHRRRHALARFLGLGPAPAAPAPQASVGRRLLAEAFAGLPYRARVAVLLVDGCGVPVLDVTAGLGWTTGRVRRALELGRRELARSVALCDADAAAIAPALGAALRSLTPPSAVTATTWARQSSLGRATA